MLSRGCRTIHYLFLSECCTGPPLNPGRISAQGWTLDYLGNSFKSLPLSLFPHSCPSVQEKAEIICQALHKMIYRMGGQERADFIRDAKRCEVTIPHGIGEETLGIEFLQGKDWPCSAPSLDYSALCGPPVADAASPQPRLCGAIPPYSLRAT